MNFIILLFMLTQPLVIFDFSSNADMNQWRIVDDVVMGGRSQGNMHLNEEGHGLFSGEVSLENNGGFSSVRYTFRTKAVAEYNFITIRVKGDGQKYQLRLRQTYYERQSYITTFKTSGEWETLKFPLKEFYPTFRGRRLNIPNFNSQQLSEIAFLIADKQQGTFSLLIDFIELD